MSSLMLKTEKPKQEPITFQRVSKSSIVEGTELYYMYILMPFYHNFGGTGYKKKL